MTRAWSAFDLAAIYGLSAAHWTLEDIAQETGRLRSEVDLALWALVGRTPEQALTRLNAPLAHAVRDDSERRIAGGGAEMKRPSGAIARFLKGMFP